jgi:hypothetical protein
MGGFMNKIKFNLSVSGCTRDERRVPNSIGVELYTEKKIKKKSNLTGKTKKEKK